MSVSPPNFGFWVRGSYVGGVRERVKLARELFADYCTLDPKIDPTREAYLSNFRFGRDFYDYLTEHQSEKGYDGVCWSAWLWWDIDRKPEQFPVGELRRDPLTHLRKALHDARCMVAHLHDYYPSLNEEDITTFWSGGKGCHVGMPLPITLTPSTAFHLACRRLAEFHAGERGVQIDTSIYSKTRCFRAPNSKHPTTGLFKRWLSHDEVMKLSIESILELAREPVGFDPPKEVRVGPEFGVAWEAAGRAASSQLQRHATYSDPAEGRQLTRATLDFISQGAEAGERNNRLFRSAAELAEFGASLELTRALLVGPARDSRLPPSEIDATIRSGFEHAKRPKGVN